MTTTSLSRRASTVGGPARAAILAGLACVAGVFAGRLAISHYGGPAIAVLIAVPILMAVVPRPLAAFILLLAMLSSVFAYDVLPRANIPGHPPLNIADIALLAAVGGTIWRRPWRTWPPPVRRFFVVLGLLLLLALFPTIKLALHGHTPAREAITGYKNLLYLTVALTIAIELSGRLWKPLLSAMIAFAVVVAVLSIIAAASGGFASLLTHVDPTAVQSAAADTTAQTARIRLPGLFFVYAMSIPTLVLVLTVNDRWRVARIVALCLMVAAIGVSLNRNMYFGGLVAILVTVLVGGPRLRHRFLFTAVTIAAAAAIFVQSAIVPAVTTEVSNRASSAFSQNVLSSGSAQARADEFSHAFTAISQNPWSGVGWFQNYGSYSAGTPRLGVEDWYLHLATDLGIPVALAFLLIPAMVLWYGFARARSATGARERALIAAGIGSVIALLLSSLVGSYLQDPGSTVVFGMSCGFLLATGMRATPEDPRAQLAGGGAAAIRAG